MLKKIPILSNQKMFCRICIKKCELENSSKIFGEKNENNLAELIIKYLYVDLKQTDTLTLICHTCKKNLNDFDKFFKTTEQRQIMYQKGVLTDNEDIAMATEAVSVKEEKDNLMEMNSESELSFGNKDSQSCDVFNESHHEGLHQMHHTQHSTYFIREDSSVDAYNPQTEDQGLYYLLESWELAHLYNIFRDQKINLKVLKHIQRHHIARLFQDLPIGDEVIFEYQLKNWQQNANVAAPTPGNIEKFNNLRNENREARGKFSLSVILSTSKHGQQLKQVYENKGCFNESQRVALINAVARYIDSNGLSFTLSDCAQLEKEIIATFPTEKLEYYTNGKRGRLYNKLSNLKRTVKQLAANEGNLNSPQTPPPSFQPEQNAEHILKLLRSEGTPREQVENLWKLCAQYRYFTISQAKSIDEILHNWPEYRQPDGYRFIDYDYQLKYPLASQMLNTWPEKWLKIQKYLKTKICNTSVAKMLCKAKDLSEDSKNLILLWSLHQAIPPSYTVLTLTSGVKQRKKFSISDSQESFAIIAKTKAEIDAKLHFLQLSGNPVLPCLLVVGDLENVQEIFVYFCGVQYTMPNILKAADICFKAFYVFDINYPEESIAFYRFVEAYIYNVRPPKQTRIATLINDLENSC